MENPLKVFYVRAPQDLRPVIAAAAKEDMRSLALETGYLLQLGLAKRAEIKNVAGRSGASRDV